MLERTVRELQGMECIRLDDAPAPKNEIACTRSFGRSVTLMAALDILNGRYGKGTVHVASTGATNRASTWGMKQERRTPHYTTSWDDIPIARA